MSASPIFSVRQLFPAMNLKMAKAEGTTNLASTDASRETELKTAEEELRKRSRVIAQYQAHLADLGSVVEKRRFNHITSVPESKVVMSTLFQQLTKSVKQIKFLEQQLNNEGKSIVSDMHQNVTKKTLTEGVGNAISSLSWVSSEHNDAKESKGNCRNDTAAKQSALHERISNAWGKEKEIVEHKNVNYDDENELNEEDEMSDNDVESQAESDESFTPEDEDEDDYCPSPQKKKEWRSKERLSGGSQGKENKSEKSDLSKFTVKELKTMLSERRLSTSGLKDELIERLTVHTELNQNKQNGNAIAEEGALQLAL